VTSGDELGYTLTIQKQLRRQRISFAFGYFCLIVLFFIVVQITDWLGSEFAAAAVLLLAIAALALAQPTTALGLVILLALVGDSISMTWWPVVKNFSSFESVLYISDGLSVNPFEIVLVVVVLTWLVTRSMNPTAGPIRWGPFWPPIVIFTASLFFGMAWGLNAGGDFRIAIFEARPLFYLAIVYLAVLNLFTTIDHYRRLLWGICIVLTIEAVHGLFRLSDIREVIAEDGSPVEHTAALHMNLVMLLLIATSWFGTSRLGKRPALFLMLIPVLILYLDAERRAAVVGLIVGGLSLSIALFTRNREKFRRIIPVMALIGIVYCGAFWNSQNQAGFPAQAVKIIVQPDSSGEKDASSDLYREIENFNMNATIRSAPITGIGFGIAFLQPIPLPDISFFEFAEYIPHNSVLWIWTKVGFVGFVSFLYIFGYGVALGVRASARIVDPDDAATVATLAAFIPMTLVVAFVDITFDAQTMILFSTSLALVASAERLTGLSVPEDGTDDPARAAAPLRTASASRH
jgi:O-antigen ligase